MKEFEELGELVEKRWRAENYSEDAFPEICAQSLAESHLPDRVDPWDIIRWVHTSAALPSQKDVDGTFGNPPITLFSGPRFYVDVYFWLDGTTSIHQHSFTGAFQVMLGSSIHSRYSFHEEKLISEHFAVGEIKLAEVKLLQKSDIHTIKPGRQYIHSLFHLDRPSATITIRTENTPSAAVQFDYRKPYFALNPFFRNVALTKKMQTVGLLLGMKHKDADAMIGDLISSSDVHTAYFVLATAAFHYKNNQLDELFGMSSGNDRYNGLLEKFRTAHGEIADLIVPVLEEQERQQNIVNRRSSITGEEHRFFLALLLNVPNREKTLELVKVRFPDIDPAEKVLDWVEELSQTRVVGSKEPNVLGIEGFNDEHIFVFEHLLKGTNVEGMKKIVETEPQGFAADFDQRLETLAKDLQTSMLFKKILDSTQ